MLKELTHSDAHEITSFGGAAVEHDTKGNRTLDQHGRSFTWDFDNRLQSATVPEGSPEGEQGTHAYTYDAMGRRVSKTTGGELTIFVCSGSQVVCEYDVAVGATPDPASPNQRYVYGSYVDEVILKDGEFTDDAVSGIVYYHRNQQYSIIALTDESGDVVERYAYTAYGQMTVLEDVLEGGLKVARETVSGKTAFANPYTYTARRFDEELGLMYFRARYYDPQTGEFISRDPLGYVDGMSMYRGYFVPGGVDPYGQQETASQDAPGFLDEVRGHLDRMNQGLEKAKLKNLLETIKKRIEDFEMWKEEVRKKVENLPADVAKSECDKWVEFDKKARPEGWTKAIPKCPCKQSDFPKRGWVESKADAALTHKGCDTCFRSLPNVFKGQTAGNQCCYEDGKLVNDGSPGGTVDAFAPFPFTAKHFVHDVVPAFICQKAGTIEKYLERRPIDQGDDGTGNPCPKHKVNIGKQ